MKNMNKKNNDILADIKSHKKFLEYSNNTGVRLRLAVEVFNARERLGLNQQQLAMKLGSTQKVVSRIENGEVNIGIEFLNRLKIALNFSTEVLSRVFNLEMPAILQVQFVARDSSMEDSIHNTSKKCLTVTNSTVNLSIINK